METLLTAEVHPGLIFFSSFAIGLLVGLERERHPEAKAGVRTFALITTFGTLCALLGEALALPWMVPMGLTVVAATLIMAYVAEPVATPDSGTTTIVAAVFCYGLGAAMWLGHLSLAVALGVVVTVLLHFKIELETFSQRLTLTDVSVTLQFAVLSLVILPLLPDRGFGPYQALNPFHVWLMVVLISGVGLAGYVSWRLLGSRGNMLVTGLLGGLVSSTATTVVYARDARDAPARAATNAYVILLASCVVFVRIGALAAIVAPSLLAPLAAVLVAGALSASPFLWRGFRLHAGAGASVAPQFGNPARLPVAVGFGLLYGLVLVIVSWLEDIAGARGLYAFAFVSGLTDVDAISLSNMRLHLEGRLDAQVATWVIAIAVISNTVFKVATAWAIGGWALAARLIIPCLSMIVAIVAAQWAVSAL